MIIENDKFILSKNEKKLLEEGKYILNKTKVNLLYLSYFLNVGDSFYTLRENGEIISKEDDFDKNLLGEKIYLENINKC